MFTIIIGFSRPKKWHLLSTLIMKVEKTDYSHAYIRIHSEKYDRDLIYQASGLAVNFMNIEMFNNHNNVIHEFEIEVSDETYLDIMRFAIDNVGIPYGSKELIGFGLIKLAALFNKKISNPFSNGTKTSVCSELVARILNDFVKLDTGNPDDVDPAVLYEKISQFSAKKIK